MLAFFYIMAYLSTTKRVTLPKRVVFVGGVPERYQSVFAPSWMWRNKPLQRDANTGVR